jgi:hypothetical protein
MKRCKFTTWDGLIMLLGVTLVFSLIMWMMLAGVLRIND